MYSALLPFHSLFRWLVLFMLLLAICRACHGILSNRDFSKTDNAIRHWTATTLHIQLILGILLYSQSPFVQMYWTQSSAGQHRDFSFFGIIHITLMLIATILLTIGSALAKRQSSYKAQFTTMLIWFSLTLLIILIAIPWPFSPLSQRPYIRMF